MHSPRAKPTTGQPQQCHPSSIAGGQTVPALVRAWLLHLCEVACRDGRGGSFLPLWLLVAPVSHGSWPWPSNCRAASSKVSSLSACQVSASNLPRLKRVCDPTPILPRPPRWDSCAVPSHPWGQGLPTSSGPSCLWLPPSMVCDDPPPCSQPAVSMGLCAGGPNPSGFPLRAGTAMRGAPEGGEQVVAALT